MNKRIKNISIVFYDNKKEEYFLLQVLNLSKNSKRDDLKFVFADHKSQVGHLYNANSDRYGIGDIIRPHAEITYHDDGTLLQKMVEYNKGHKTIYKNPHGAGNKRTALSAITFWEPFIRYRVVNYKICKKQEISNKVILPEKVNVFNGDPFECTLFVGEKKTPTPKETDKNLAFRLTQIATKVDILLAIVKSDFSGEWMQLGKSSKKVFSQNNIIDIVQWNSNNAI